MISLIENLKIYLEEYDSLRDRDLIMLKIYNKMDTKKIFVQWFKSFAAPKWTGINSDAVSPKQN